MVESRTPLMWPDFRIAQRGIPLSCIVGLAIPQPYPIRLLSYHVPALDLIALRGRCKERYADDPLREGNINHKSEWLTWTLLPIVPRRGVEPR